MREGIYYRGWIGNGKKRVYDPMPYKVYGSWYGGKVKLIGEASDIESAEAIAGGLRDIIALLKRNVEEIKTGR